MSGLNVPAGVKIKGMYIVPNISYPSWDQMWVTEYNWAGWIQPQIDACSGLGANTIKASMPIETIAAGGSGATTAITNLTTFANYCVAQGLLIYPEIYVTPVTGAPGASYLTAIASIGTLFGAYSNVIGFDGNEEINAGGTTTTNAQLWMAAVTPAWQAVTSIPITYSIYATSSTQFETGSGTWLDTIAPYTDYIDIHPYLGGASTPSATQPIVALWNAYRAASYYAPPWIVGENGSPLSAGTSAQTARWQALGYMQAAYDSAGVVGFCIADYASDSADQFGVYDSTLANPRSQITVPYAAWETADPPVSYASTILATSGIQGFWELGEASGTVATDATGNYNMAYVVGTSLGNAGIPGGGGATSAKFNGTTQAANNAAGVGVGDVMTLECWLKLSTTGNAINTMFSCVDTGGPTYRIDGSGRIVIIKDAVSVIGTTTVTITDTTTWHHVVWTKNGATNHVYLDGVDVTPAITNATLANLTNGYAIAVDQAGLFTGTWFPGNLQFVALYNVALSASQVANHYNLGAGLLNSGMFMCL